MVIGHTTKPLMHEVTRRAAANLVPIQAGLELTYGCNMVCKHCYIDLALRRNASESGELSTREWLDVLEQLVEMGTLSLLLTGGEILTRSDFFEIAFEAKRKGFLIWLATNATLIDSRVATNIKELGPQCVGVSLYGATAEGHESVTSRAGSFEATVGAIRRLRERGVPVIIQALLMDSNVQQARDVLELGSELDAGVHLGYELAPTKGCALSPRHHEVTFKQLEAYLPLEKIREEFPRERPGVCQAGRATCTISPTGDVFPCLMMPLRVGSVRERSLEEVWRNDPSEDLVYLRSIDEEDLTECQDCNIASFCNRCPGVALGETGSLTGRQPSACRHAAFRARCFEEDVEEVYT
jgi:radical SAM protein with 4Fe4S-binding SPASM domain